MSPLPTPAEQAAARRIVAAIHKMLRDLGHRSEKPQTVTMLEAAFAVLIAQETGGVASLNALKACVHEFEGDSGTGVSYWEDRPVYINAMKAIAKQEARA